MAASISRRIISKLASTRLLAPSYVFVKPSSAIDGSHRRHHPWLSSSSTRFSRSQSSDSTVVASDKDWTPPLLGTLVPNWDPGHYLCYLGTQGLEYASADEALAAYIHTLASVDGSVEDAKQRIYLASCEWYCCCFGAKIDEQTKNKLQELPNVLDVYPDLYAHVRDKAPTAHTKFAPLNWNHRLFNIDDYYKSSECKKQGDSCHWLIKVKRPDGELSRIDEAIEWCTQFLAKFVGREEARKRIYAIWCNEPFGFGAEIEKGVSEQLAAQPNVEVLEDHAFDVKRKNLGVLVSITEVDGTPKVLYWADDENNSGDDLDPNDARL